MRDKSLYQEIIDEFGEKEVAGRASSLYQKMNEFINKYDFPKPISISRNLFAHVIVDYFADLARMIKFQGMKDFVNREKHVAYTAYWVCRRKPIQFTSANIEFDERIYVNEAFVATYIREELQNMNSGKKMSKEFYNHLYYHLKYRLLDARAVELMIIAFKSGKSIP
jgi:hypothetical protein